VLLVHPQVGFWEVAGARAIVLLGAQGGGPTAPVLFQPTVADLDACARQVAPFANGIAISTSTHTPRDATDVLDSNDCAQLLHLDPYVGVGQRLPSAPNVRVARADRHPTATLYGVDPISKNNLVVTLSDTITYANMTTATNVGSYGASVTGVVTSMNSTNFTLSGYGVGYSQKFDGSTATTNASDWTVTFQSSFAATATSSIGISGTLDDSNQSLPESPRVFIFQDTMFGGFMFQDPDAPGP